MPDKPMNIRWELFCKEYIATDFNGTQAATNAKFSARTARAKACSLLKDPRIKARLSELINEALGTSREQLRYKVVKKWDRLAFADLTEDIKIITKKVNVNELIDGVTREVEKEFQVVETLDTSISKNKDLISSVKQTKDGIEIKYRDQDKALEFLGKYGGLLTDKLEIESTGPEVHIYLPDNGRSPTE